MWLCPSVIAVPDGLAAPLTGNLLHTNYIKTDYYLPDSLAALNTALFRRGRS